MAGYRAISHIERDEERSAGELEGGEAGRHAAQQTWARGDSSLRASMYNTYESGVRVREE